MSESKEMEKFKEKFIRFMYGRYGVYGLDDLYKFLSYSSIVLIILAFIASTVTPVGPARLIVSSSFTGVILLIAGFNMFRFLSKNIVARRKENERFVRLKKALKRFFTLNTSYGTRSANRDGETLIFRDCTYCGSILRLPRRKGRNKVKCPRCSKSFYVSAGKYNQKKK